jgi:chromosome segregation ATPase
MKNLLFLLIPAGLILSSCGNIEKYQEQVSDLSSSWENMTGTVTETIDRLNEGKNEYRRLLQGTTPAEATKENLSEDAKQVIEDTNAKLKAEAEPMFDELTQKITDFSSQWQEATDKLSNLKNSLAEGKLPEGAEETIKELQDMLNTAKANLGDWNSKIGEATAISREIYSPMGEITKTMTSGSAE